MRRRAVLAGIAAAAAAPTKVIAQSPARVRRIGVITGLARPTSIASSILGGFPQGMSELGYVEGRDYMIEWRFADGRYDALPGFVLGLIGLPVDAIVIGSTAAIPVAKRATSIVPIVLAYSVDPVGNGFVESLARPRGNITGLASSSDDSAPKRLGLMKEVIPGLSRVGVLWNPDSPVTQAVRTTAAAAREAGLTAILIESRTVPELERVFSGITGQRLDALVVTPDSFFNARRERIAALAIANKVPTIFAQREYAEAGGLMSYGESTREFYRRAATYVDKILKGAKPGDLPMEQPTRFFLTINLTTGKALGIELPASLLARADELIE